MPRGVANVAFNVRGGQRLGDISRRLRAAGKGELNRALQRAIRDAAAPVIVELQDAAMRIPDRSTAVRRDGRSIRRELRGAIRLSATQNGVRLFVDAARLPADSAAMARTFESKRGWRHPVFARGTQTRREWTWVRQKGAPWFRPTVRRNGRTFERSVRAALDLVAREIEG